MKVISQEIMDAQLYARFNYGQMRGAIEFFSRTADKLRWGLLSGKIALDAGCGPGSTSCTWILSMFPEIKHLIGLDVSEAMIDLAKFLFAHPKVEYSVSDLQEWSALEPWRGQVSVVFSTYVFHWLQNQKQAFTNIFDVLQPGGEAAILFEIKSTYWDTYNDLIHNSKWTEYLKDSGFSCPDPSVKDHGELEYKEMLEDIGFEIILCKEEPHSYKTISEEECKIYITTMNPFKGLIPEDLNDEFEVDLVKSFKKANSHSSDGDTGLPVYDYIVLQAVIRKPYEQNV